jgi:nitronate monooxygenase/enoyl-[acyl-carrier protein] reductase II
MRTPFTELLGIRHPIVQASLGPWTSAELTAAVSAAGGLGSLGTALRSADQLRADVARVRELTDQPFCINHTLRPFDEDIYALTLELAPAMVSLAIGARADLVERAHRAGAVFMQQVHTVAQAREAAAMGVDVIIAQGGEAGGFGGALGTMGLVPQVADAVAPIPVLAAGGIADGRGIAAALALGAAGVNIGTRFLASKEARIDAAWKGRILGAASEDTVKVQFAPRVFPPVGEGGYTTLPRVLRTDFVERGNADPEAMDGMGPELVAAVREGRAHEMLPFTGETVGLIHDVRPAGEIVERLVAEAERAIARLA